MYTSENHFNTKASDCAIEEVYTNLDIGKDCEYDPKIGYTFYYPYRFVNDPAQLKAVGVRYLDIQPSKHSIEINIRVSFRINSMGAYYTVGHTYYMEVLPNNKLMEVLCPICKSFNEKLKQDFLVSDLELGYSYGDGILCFSLWDDGLPYKDGKVRISGDVEFLKFLNQPTDLVIPDFENSGFEQTFENVWDRNYIEFHATFSDSNRNFIGIKDDFYTRPSLFYLVPSNTSSFNIRFTNDGIIPVLPRYCRFVIQLCFVLNYKMFKI